MEPPKVRHPDVGLDMRPVLAVHFVYKGLKSVVESVPKTIDWGIKTYLPQGKPNQVGGFADLSL
jgi:hypothetical protein